MSEGTAGPDGYKTLYTNKKITSFEYHPWSPRATPKLNPDDFRVTKGAIAGKYSSAAGAYQYTYPTWKEVNGGVDAPFTPENQDMACIRHLKRIGVYAVLATKDPADGDLNAALLRVAKIWANTPYSPDGQRQPGWTYTRWRNLYIAAGGQTKT